MLIYTRGWMLLLLTVPTVAVMVAIVAIGKPRGWRLAIITMLISWLTCPIWAGIFIGLGIGMSVHADFLPMIALAVIPALIVLMLAVRALKRPLAGASIGLASYITPIIGVAMYEPGGLVFAAVISAIIWNLWAVGSLLLDPLFAPKRTPGHCHNCGYDLTGIETDRCPECGVERQNA